MMVKQILSQLQILGGLAVLGFSAGWAEAQIVSSPANFRSGQAAAAAARPAYSYAPPTAFQQGGYKISSITPGLAADRYGFKNGDVIIQVNGKPFRTEDDFNGLLRQSYFGSKITYFEAGSGIVKMREVKHVFARLGISGQIVPLNAPNAVPAAFPTGAFPTGAFPAGAFPAGAIPPGPIGLPPGAIIPPQSGPALPGF